MQMLPTPMRLSWLLFLALPSTAQQGTWRGCFDPQLPKKVKIGQPTRVCMQVGNGVNWAAGVNYVRASFEPKADEYSYYHIPNCRLRKVRVHRDMTMEPYFSYSLTFVSFRSLHGFNRNGWSLCPTQHHCGSRIPNSPQFLANVL